MSPSFWQRSLADFQHEVETRSTPGCGAAAALNGCLGLSLILKGVRLHRDDRQTPARDRLVAKGDALRRSLAKAVDDDAAAFAGYLDAQRRPHTTEAESQTRDVALNEAREASIRIPLNAADDCLAALALAVEALPLTSSALQSDTRAGSVMLEAALEALLIGVEANLDALPDPASRHKLNGRCEELRSKARCLADRMRSS